jgi:AraC-like DNA-binding protein
MLGVYSFNPIYIYHLGLLLFIFSVTYYGIQQPDILKNALNEEMVERVVDNQTNWNSQQFSEQYNEQYIEFGQQMEYYMTNHKPYLDGELTIHQLADMLEVPSAKISIYLNHYLNKNFFTYINEYRVMEAKRRIADTAYNHLTLVSIGLDSGFNSKSSFNSLFKKYTSQTPSEYKKRIVQIKL